MATITKQFENVSKAYKLMIILLGLAIMSSVPALSAQDKGVPPAGVVADPQTNFLAIQVGGNGRFNVGANPTAVDCGQGPTFPTPCRYNLSFAWPIPPGTSFTTVRIDGADYIYGDSGGVPIIVPPADSPDFLTNTSAAQRSNLPVRVTQVLSIVQGLSGSLDTARIRYVITNLDNAPHDVGLRLMVDTMLNNNDGAPFRVGGDAVTTETDYVGTAVPSSFDAFFNLNVPTISSHGTLRGSGATAPDRFVIASWPRIFGTLFDFTVSPGTAVTSDSAIAAYWNPVTVQPGASRVLDTFYGVSPAVGGAGLLVVAPAAIGIAPGPTAGSVVWSPNPFIVDAFFTSASAGTFSILLDLSTAATQLNTASPNPISVTLAAGQTAHAQWSVNVVRSGTANYRVIVSTGRSEVTRRDLTTQVPELVVPPTDNPLNPNTIHLEADGQFCPNANIPCNAAFPGNVGGVPPNQFEWRGITPVAFVPAAAGATPTLLTDHNARSFVYTAVDREGTTGDLSLYLMYDFLHRTTNWLPGDNPTVTFDVTGGRFAGRMLVTIGCTTHTISVSGFDNGIAFFGRDGAALGIEGGCGFGKSPNPSGDPFVDSFFDPVDQVTEGFNINHGMFELEVPLTKRLGGADAPNGVYDPRPAFWSASAPGSGVLVLSQNTVAIDINIGANTVTPLAAVAPTTLTYTGATSGDFHDPVTLSARLTSGTSAPVPNQTITFTIGTQNCTGVTNASGAASCNLTLNQIPGPYTVSASFAATGLFQASNASAPFTISREETTLSYTGDTVIANNTTANLSGVLLEDGMVPIAGRTVVFTLGTGGSAQTCTGITNAAGTAACTISPVNQPLGSGVVSDNFAGDAFYLLSSARANTIVFAFLSQGSFVLGDKTALVGPNPVTFWSSKWSALNELSGGSASPSFKGFASSISTSPPRCGDVWSSRPGNRAQPPDTLPLYMGVVVSSTISDSPASSPSGDVLKIVVVKTDGNYAPNPGHPGTGTVVAVYCK